MPKKQRNKKKASEEIRDLIKTMPLPDLIFYFESNIPSIDEDIDGKSTAELAQGAANYIDDKYNKTLVNIGKKYGQDRALCEKAERQMIDIIQNKLIKDNSMVEGDAKKYAPKIAENLILLLATNPNMWGNKNYMTLASRKAVGGRVELGYVVNNVFPVEYVESTLDYIIRYQVKMESRANLDKRAQYVMSRLEEVEEEKGPEELAAAAREKQVRDYPVTAQANKGSVSLDDGFFDIKFAELQRAEDASLSVANQGGGDQPEKQDGVAGKEPTTTNVVKLPADVVVNLTGIIQGLQPVQNRQIGGRKEEREMSELEKVFESFKKRKEHRSRVGDQVSRSSLDREPGSPTSIVTSHDKDRKI